MAKSSRLEAELRARELEDLRRHELEVQRLKKKLRGDDEQPIAKDVDKSGNKPGKRRLSNSAPDDDRVPKVSRNDVYRPPRQPFGIKNLHSSDLENSGRITNTPEFLKHVLEKAQGLARQAEARTQREATRRAAEQHAYNPGPALDTFQHHAERDARRLVKQEARRPEKQVGRRALKDAVMAKQAEVDAARQEARANNHDALEDPDNVTIWSDTDSEDDAAAACDAGAEGDTTADFPMGSRQGSPMTDGSDALD